MTRRWLGRGVLVLSIGLGMFWSAVRIDPPPVPGSPHPAAPASSSPTDAPGDRARYLGAFACAACHEERYREFAATTHALTSAKAGPGTIKGSFVPPRNFLKTRNRHLIYEMQARPDGFFQTGRRPAPPGTPYRTGRIDLVIGSGKLGQSFVQERPDGLFQTPVSYVTAGDTWSCSPGYEDGGIDFDRPVRPACLECHATYVKSAHYRSNAFKVSDIVLGISCERCHGPGSEHVEHHNRNPKLTTGAFIVDPRSLSRRARLDLCAQCHARLGAPRSPAPFSFRPGRPLEEFFEPAPREPPEKADEASPHAANQLERLEESRCFASGRMDCVTCHDPHVVQRGSAPFSKACLGCHKAAVCPEVVRFGSQLHDRCIDCHMPRRTLAEGRMAGGQMLPRMRDHRIAKQADQRDRLRAELGLSSK